MTSPRALRPEQNDRIRALTKWVVDKEGGSQTDAAKALGVGRHLVTQHLLGKGAGHLLIDALRKYTGKTYDEIVDGEPGPVPVARESLERDDRYPARAAAVVAWRALKRDEAVVERIRSLQMQGGETATEEDWFADMEREERAMRRGAKVGPPVSESDVGGDVDTSWRR